MNWEPKQLQDLSSKSVGFPKYLEKCQWRENILLEVLK